MVIVLLNLWLLHDQFYVFMQMMHEVGYDWVEMVDTASITAGTDVQSEFDAIAREVEQSEKVDNQATSDNDEPMLSDEEIADMIVSQGVVNTCIRQMKESEERMKEILDEEV